MAHKYLLTYNPDGTIASVGKIESIDEGFIDSIKDTTSESENTPGIMLLDKSKHDTLINNLDEHIVDGKAIRKRTDIEMRQRLLSILQGVRDGKIFLHPEPDIFTRYGKFLTQEEINELQLTRVGVRL